MTTTERDWTRADPYAGQQLPAPPAWLPGAGDAVHAVAPSAEEPDADERAGGVGGVAVTSATAVTGAAVGGPAVAGPTADEPTATGPFVTEPTAGAPDLAKRQPGASAAETPTAPVARYAEPSPRPSAAPSAPPAHDATDFEDDDGGWSYVPLNIAHTEAPDGPPDGSLTEPPAEPHYVNPDIIEPPDLRAEPSDVAGLPGQHWFDEGPKDRPWHLIALAGALVVFIGVIVAILVAGGDGGGKDKTTAREPSASALPSQAMPTEAVAARPVPADQLDALRPQAVRVGTFDGELQVTWDPPRSPGTVSGYFVIAQTPGTGQVEERRLVERDSELTVVFDETEVCVVVTTVVSSPEGLQLARGDLVCPPAPTTGSPDA